MEGYHRAVHDSHRSLPRPLPSPRFSAILMTLAVPNELFKHGLVPLGFIALVPLYLAVLELGSPRGSALVTGLFGALQHALTSFWLWFFQDFRIWTLGSTTLAYFVVYAVLGLYSGSSSIAAEGRGPSPSSSSGPPSNTKNPSASSAIPGDSFPIR